MESTGYIHNVARDHSDRAMDDRVDAIGRAVVEVMVGDTVKNMVEDITENILGDIAENIVGDVAEEKIGEDMVQDIVNQKTAEYIKTRVVHNNQLGTVGYVTVPANGGSDVYYENHIIKIAERLNALIKALRSANIMNG